MHIKMIFQKLNIIGKKLIRHRAFRLNGDACMQKNNEGLKIILLIIKLFSYE